MDRVIEKNKWSAKRILPWIGGVAVIGLIAASYFNTTGNSKLNVEEDKIMISEVSKGSFQEFIPVNGIVMPIQTIYLDALEGGRVEELYVEDGAIVKKEQPLLKLSNTDLELDLANRETSVFQLITQMQYTQNLARENTIRQQANLADIDNALVEAKRVYELNSRLHKEKVISEQDYKSSLNLYNYNVRRKSLIEKTLKQDSITTATQLTQMKETVARTQETLKLMRKKASDLVVKAPVAGQLTSRNAEIGENKVRGVRLGQIDVLSGFKVRADIDEHYIARVFIGLTGEFTISDKTYKLRVKKVYSQVTNGRFQVDMEFVGTPPSDIRRGQTLQVRLSLSDQTQAVLLAKGGFYQQTGGNWIFKVGENGQKAYKVDIQLGRQNPEFYEVLEGLKPGDKVVTSSYENYGDMQELVIKKTP
ncbi:efflux RND transporter periplasmic adaptor subunit [Arcicella lustrica]|uniref:HlyD family efflux transporter periplasmic adaptor subunit n=1 Tax=Arcicella lustrica TaxID=2984196 RepID=A0ABU5SIV1_9BACT|nr:HlyD family efflux transporter periplasmic adaptor subunit [Arcicella sp. DC25W]MEA5427169.1 HlyD family efflux transporter periplasmic adaptor subunit [Arcicella sp. DC25W]